MVEEAELIDVTNAQARIRQTDQEQTWEITLVDGIPRLSRFPLDASRKSTDTSKGARKSSTVTKARPKR
jgi:hypothetical protein